MFYSFYKIWKPSIFQGHGKKDRYFEGWYYKNVNAAGTGAFAIIPGISLSGGNSHSFIQFFNSRDKKAHYFKYPVGSFLADKKSFEISIGNSVFTEDRIALDASDGALTLKGDLRFTGIHPWPVSPMSPGAMGWYAFAPTMECYHGVLSFNHRIEGFLDINGARNDYTGGRGYMEKDWGISMPSSWIWMQTNHFSDPDASLFLSIAKIPWRGSYFNGHIAGFLYRGTVQRFATYTGARLRKLLVDGNRVEACIEDRSMGLHIIGFREEGADLPAPKLGEMTAKVNESLQSTVEVEFYTKGGDVIFRGTGDHAGLEIVGNTDELIK